MCHTYQLPLLHAQPALRRISIDDISALTITHTTETNAIITAAIVTKTGITDFLLTVQTIDE